MASKDNTAEVEKLRRKVRTLKGEMEDLELGRLTATETRERLHQWVDLQAERVDAFGLVASATIGSDAINGQAFKTSADGIVQGAATNATVGIAPYLAWLDPEAMKRRLTAELEAHADELCSDTPAKDRAAALKKARTELRTLETTEERLIVEAQSAGITIARRPDINPEIILEATS